MRNKAPAHAKLARAAAGLWQLLICDVVYASAGFRGLHWLLRRTRVERSRQADAEAIVNGLEWAVCFYFKPVRCLQKSVALARLLRRDGIAAQVIAGYRMEPFFAHAWVEAEGRSLGDFPRIRRSMTLCMPMNPAGSESAWRKHSIDAV